MKVGLFTALLANLSLDDVIRKIKPLGLRAVELGTGNYPGDPHLKLEWLNSASKLKEFKLKLADQGIVISALSCHGNPLHPNKKIAAAHAEVSRKTIMLAEKLEVQAVNDFSGCPGDHENAKFILLLSSHLETGHYFNPHAQRITEGKARGAKLCAIDVRLSNTAAMADYWLAPWPGTEAFLLLAMAHVILKERLYDRRFLEQWVGWREYMAARRSGRAARASSASRSRHSSAKRAWCATWTRTRSPTSCWPGSKATEEDLVDSLLCLLTTEPDGSLPRPAFEALAACRELASALGVPFDVGLLGAEVQAAADGLDEEWTDEVMRVAIRAGGVKGGADVAGQADTVRPAADD